MQTPRPSPAAHRNQRVARPSRALPTLLALLGLTFVPARADESSDVQGLYRSGQTQAAMARADKFLVARPDDLQMRFLKGVMLADARRNDEAAGIFLKLTQDHPDLVEPYNNLAALQAAAGDYAKARATLELALRADPGFATAHENLGDVYAAMAAQAYARAQQLAPTSTTLAPKLALLRQLLVPRADAAAE